jgi:hypothetical protein
MVCREIMVDLEPIEEDYYNDKDKRKLIYERDECIVNTVVKGLI